ncbi:MAG: FimV/HubP family polar landmark protein [Xanthomonadales bacterium]|nr:FimV/HubP family polar landmark protein [Xanthomonadales bacterium]
MSTIKKTGAMALSGILSLLFSFPAWSLGLGAVTVESYLNQPLQVRIELLTNESDDLSTVTAQVASASDYELIGASRDAVPVPIRFTVTESSGETYLLGSSRLPINDPVVRLIVEVNWANGRMLREYTLFLDPPAVTASPPPPRIDTRSSAQPAVPGPQSATGPTAAPTAQYDPRPSEYGPVANGETLWAIARDWSQGTDLSINQAMIAIQRENPSAFLQDNINLLRRGAILRLPEVGEAQSISESAARREVSAQAEAFAQRTAAPDPTNPATPLVSEARTAVESPLPERTAETGAATDEAETAGKPSASGEPAPLRDQLELVPPSETEDMDSVTGFEESPGEAEAPLEPQALREELSRTEEELFNQRQQNAYLEQQIAELESRLAEAEEGVAEDADMSSMEERLRAEREQAAAREEAEKPWFSGLVIWLIALLVLAAGIVAWLFSRRRSSLPAETVAVRNQESLRDLQGEAEDLLRTLDEERTEVTDGVPGVPLPEAESEAPPPAARPVVETDEDAELLDEESADPEIQLDLARAYISMGDKEAARVILEEVLTHGSEQQQADARAMMERL